MEIIHVAAECYPMAKVGGLADVVGALPKYQNQLGHIAKVVLPMYKTKFLYNNVFNTVHKGSIHVGEYYFNYTVIKERDNKLGFDLYLIDINGLLDRENVYGYNDDYLRFLAFQIATLNWLCAWQHKPDVLHCHDYHAGLIPFMAKHCTYYNQLQNIKTILTIHNGQYQGWMQLSMANLLPQFDPYKTGLLAWNGMLNPLAAAVKCADRVNAVSPGYMQELSYDANGLEMLFEYEKGKCIGIINGIDNEIWNPETDSYLREKFSVKNAKKGKEKNKNLICEMFNLPKNKPLISFIGRLVGEKAADILPQAIATILTNNKGNVNIVVLGSGDKKVEKELNDLKYIFGENYDCFIGYSEALSHELYAASDFLLMPSRVEPCGLNQLYALRYGTLPIVRNTGGLKDTVIDISQKNGYGIKHDQATVVDINFAVMRALNFYYEEAEKFTFLQKEVMKIDFSWTNSAKSYLEMYKN